MGHPQYAGRPVRFMETHSGRREVTSDDEKRKKAEKSEKRKKAKAAKIARLEKKILSVGYCNLEPYSLDRIHADKWLGSVRIEELEELRQQKMEEKQTEARQMSLEDFIEMEGSA